MKNQHYLLRPSLVYQPYLQAVLWQNLMKSL